MGKMKRSNPKSKSARKGKKLWRKISSEEVEDFNEKASKDSLSGRPLNSLPSNSLFFVDKSTDVDVRRKIDKTREKVLRYESVLQKNPFVEVVPSSTLKKKNKSDKSASKDGIDTDASVGADSKANEVGGKQDPGMVDLWSDGGCNTKKGKKKGKASAIPAAEVEPAGCSFNPEPESHKRYFMDADSGREDNADEETPAGDADTTTENRSSQKKRITRVVLNKRARRKEVLKAESEAKKKENLAKEIYSISDVMQEIDEVEEESKNRNLRRVVAKQERLKSCPPRLGKRKFEPAPVQVLLSEEISGSLRKLQGCCTVARDRYKSLEKRGLVVPSSKKRREGMESECRVAWADLPAELLAMICEGLKESCDMTRFRGVCRSWRSSVTEIPPNKISPLFPHTLPHWRQSKYRFRCTSHPRYLIANAVYHLRSSTNKLDNWIVSVQESKPGKLLLRHALTSEPIPGSSGLALNLLSWGLTPTRLSIYHRFHSRSSCVCGICWLDAKSKLVLFPNPADANSMALVYLSNGRLFAVGRCLSNHPEDHLVARIVRDIVNFNGRVYAVNAIGLVSVLDHTLFQLLPLTSAYNIDQPSSGSVVVYAGKRFVVSDGDLYLVFNYCKVATQQADLYKVYKLVMNDDIDAPTLCNLERVKNLGDRVFFINKDCSFSVSARDLPPPFVRNCIVVGKSAFRGCDPISRSHIYHLGV